MKEQLANHPVKEQVAEVGKAPVSIAKEEAFYKAYPCSSPCLRLKCEVVTCIKTPINSPYLPIVY